MEKQTALRWLIEKIHNKDMGNVPMWVYDFCQEAIPMESKQLDNAFKLGLEFGNTTGGNNNLDKIEVYNILKNLMSVEDDLISKYPELLSFIENVYEQLNKTQGVTMELLRNFKKDDVINPMMEQVINQLKNQYYGR